MKFDDLLCHRDELLMAARLANVAYAYQWIGDFAARISRSDLRGEVVLRAADVDSNRSQPALLAQDFSQAVIDEHFLPEEIAELHEVLRLVHDGSTTLEARFRLEEIGAVYLPALRCVLDAADASPRERFPSVKGFNLDAA